MTQSPDFAPDFEATALAFYDLLADQKMERFFELWSDEPAFEMPFPAPGLKPRYPGQTGVRKFFTTFRGALSEARWIVDRIYPRAEASILVVEGRGVCATTTGRRYDNQYLWIYDFDARGRIARLQEHSNPLVITDSFGGADVLGPAFA